MRAYEAVTCRRSVDALTSGRGALLMQNSKRLQTHMFQSKALAAQQGRNLAWQMLCIYMCMTFNINLLPVS